MHASVSQTASPPLIRLGVSRRELVWRASLGLLAAALLSFGLLPTQTDNDLWGHLRVGLDILQSHSAPRVDVYAYTHSGTLTQDHEWLGEALAALSWKGAGTAGLVALKISLALLTGILCFWHLLRTGISSGRATAILLILIGLVPPFMMFRPLLFSIPGFAVTLTVIYEAECGNRAVLWMLPPLYVIWANLHGGFLAGLAVLCIWGVLHAFARRRVASIAAPVAVTFAATGLNPYGWGLLAFLLRTATVPRPEIIEWNPLRVTAPYGIIYTAILAVAVVGWVFSRVEKKWPLVALFGVISLLPFSATRHTPLAVVAGVILAGPHIGDALRRLAEAGPASSRRRMAALPAWALALPLIGLTVLVVAAAERPVLIPVSDQEYPVQAVKLLAASGVEGNLVNQFNWGEYIMWHLGPKVKVMMDGRREWIYSDEVYQRYLSFQNGSGDWDRLLREYPADVALLQEGSTAFNLFRLKSEWQQVYHDGVASIFVRSGSTEGEQITEAARRFAPTPGPFYFP